MVAAQDLFGHRQARFLGTHAQLEGGDALVQDGSSQSGTGSGNMHR
jgi:hypothetical protein